MDEPIPIKKLAHTGTNPHPGVIPTNPHTHPFVNPIILGLWPLTYSNSIQVSPPVAAEKLVFRRAMTEKWFTAKAEPPLKPNQPNQSIAVPSRLLRMFWEVGESSWFRPSTMANAKLLKPADMWTTLPKFIF